jgi:hypothetical protein
MVEVVVAWVERVEEAKTRALSGRGSRGLCYVAAIEHLRCGGGWDHRS